MAVRFDELEKIKVSTTNEKFQMNLNNGNTIHNDNYLFLDDLGSIDGNFIYSGPFFEKYLSENKISSHNVGLTLRKFRNEIITISDCDELIQKQIEFGIYLKSLDPKLMTDKIIYNFIVDNKLILIRAFAKLKIKRIYEGLDDIIIQNTDIIIIFICQTLKDILDEMSVIDNKTLHRKEHKYATLFDNPLRLIDNKDINDLIAKIKLTLDKTDNKTDNKPNENIKSTLYARTTLKWIKYEIVKMNNSIKLNKIKSTFEEYIKNLGPELRSDKDINNIIIIIRSKITEQYTKLNPSNLTNEPDKPINRSDKLIDCICKALTKIKDNVIAIHDPKILKQRRLEFEENFNSLDLSLKMNKKINDLIIDIERFIAGRIRKFGLQIIEGCHDNISEPPVIAISVPLIITAGTNGNINFWCPLRGKIIRTIYAHDKFIWSITCCSFINRIASIADGKCIKIWDYHTKLLVSIIFRSASLICYSSDGQYLVLVNFGMIEILNTTTNDIIYSLCGPNIEITTLHFSLDNTNMACGYVNGMIKIWNVKYTKPYCDINFSHCRIQSLSFTPNNDKIVFGDDNNHIFIVDNRTGTNFFQFKLLHSIRCLRFWSNYILIGGCNNNIEFLDVINGEICKVLNDTKSIKTYQVKDMFISADNKQLVSMDHQTIRIWDLEMKMLIREINIEKSNQFMMCSPNWH